MCCSKAESESTRLPAEINLSCEKTTFAAMHDSTHTDIGGRLMELHWFNKASARCYIQ